jgi:hypothetical protein
MKVSVPQSFRDQWAEGLVPKSHIPLGYGTGTNPDSGTAKSVPELPNALIRILLSRAATGRSGTAVDT